MANIRVSEISELLLQPLNLRGEIKVHKPRFINQGTFLSLIGICYEQKNNKQHKILYWLLLFFFAFFLLLLSLFLLLFFFLLMLLFLNTSFFSYPALDFYSVFL